jgi:hypothetical protein
MTNDFKLNTMLRISSITLGIFLFIAPVIWWMTISAYYPGETQLRLIIDNWKVYLVIVAVMFCGTKLIRYRWVEK